MGRRGVRSWVFSTALLLLVSAGFVAACLLPFPYKALFGHSFMLIGVPGMLGGLLYAMFTGVLTVPSLNEDADVRLGVVADMLYGLAGGYAVFLLMPGSFDVAEDVDAESLWKFVKVVALAVVGGFGGRPIISAVLSQVLERKIDQVERKQEKTQERQEKHERLLALIARQLDPSSEPDPARLAEMKALLREAPDDVKSEAFYRARDARGRGFRDERLKSTIERTVPIFQALIESDVARNFHRNYGQLGYALRDQARPDLAGAVQALTTAIQVRDRTNGGDYGLYEMARALCLIEQDPRLAEGKSSDADQRTAIIADLAAAAKSRQARDILARIVAEKSPSAKALRKWLELNGLKAEAEPLIADLLKQA